MSLVRGAVALAAFTLSATAFAQKPLAIPAAGQSMEQQRRDDALCLDDVKRKTGFDPALAVPPSTVSNLGPAATTGMIPPRAARETAREERREAQASAQAERDRQDDFYREYGACMRDRGYNVR